MLCPNFIENRFAEKKMTQKDVCRFFAASRKYFTDGETFLTIIALGQVFPVTEIDNLRLFQFT